MNQDARVTARVTAGVTFAAKLAFDNINHSFNARSATLRDVTLTAEPGEVLCLLGRYTNRNHGWCRRSQVKMAEELSCAPCVPRLTKLGGQRGERVCAFRVRPRYVRSLDGLG